MTTIRPLLLLALGFAATTSAAAGADVILLAPLEIRAAQPLAPASYLVGKDGRVGDVSVATSSGSRILDDVAADAVKKWTFAPARRGSRPVESVVEVPLKFALSRE